MNAEFYVVICLLSLAFQADLRPCLSLLRCSWLSRNRESPYLIFTFMWLVFGNSIMSVIGFSFRFNFSSLAGSFGVFYYSFSQFLQAWSLDEMVVVLRFHRQRNPHLGFWVWPFYCVKNIEIEYSLIMFLILLKHSQCLQSSGTLLRPRPRCSCFRWPIAQCPAFRAAYTSLPSAGFELPSSSRALRAAEGCCLRVYNLGYLHLLQLPQILAFWLPLLHRRHLPGRRLLLARRRDHRYRYQSCWWHPTSDCFGWCPQYLYSFHQSWIAQKCSDLLLDQIVSCHRPIWHQQHSIPILENLIQVFHLPFLQPLNLVALSLQLSYFRFRWALLEAPAFLVLSSRPPLSSTPAWPSLLWTCQLWQAVINHLYRPFHLHYSNLDLVWRH